jgi:hypothetical protein
MHRRPMVLARALLVCGLTRGISRKQSLPHRPFFCSQQSSESMIRTPVYTVIPAALTHPSRLFSEDDGSLAQARNGIKPLHSWGDAPGPVPQDSFIKFCGVERRAIVAKCSSISRRVCSAVMLRFGTNARPPYSWLPTTPSRSRTALRLLCHSILPAPPDGSGGVAL